MNKHIIGDLFEYVIGGGWGSETPDGDQNTPNYVIRSADFPSIERGSFAGVPLRFDTLNFVNKRSLQDGDILLEISGGTKNRPTGRTIYISENLLSSVEHAVIPASFCRLLRFKKEVVFPKYMYYLLQSWWTSGGSWEFQNQSTGIANFQFKIFAEKFEVSLPSLKEQERIAGILGSLDDKIEANTRLIQTLDSLGEAVVRKYLKSVQKTKKLIDIAHIVMGQSPKGETLNTEGSGVLFFQGKKDFGFRYPTPRTYTTAATRMAEPLDILFSVRAPIGALNRSVESCCVGRGLAAIRSSCGQENTLFYTLKTNPNLWEKFEGEGTIFSAINKKGLSELDIPFSETAISNGVEDFLTSVEQEIFSLEQENLQLATTRDALIKRLIGYRR